MINNDQEKIIQECQNCLYFMADESSNPFWLNNTKCYYYPEGMNVPPIYHCQHYQYTITPQIHKRKERNKNGTN